MSFESTAVVFEQPRHLALNRVALTPPGDGDCVVDIEWSGISTGTERLLWLGEMPDFPGMGYPLVPGYESVGRIVRGGEAQGLRPGDRVFVPGSGGFVGVRGLFGGAASRVVAKAERLVRIEDGMAEQGTLLALAATAHHALAVGGKDQMPELVIGHGVLGRLVARLVIAMGGKPPTVWETDVERRDGYFGYPLIDPGDDDRRDYRSAIDVSGSSTILDSLVPNMAKGARVVLAGFYKQPVSFMFAPAFMREIAIQVAAEWLPQDLAQVMTLIERRALSLAGLITNSESPQNAPAAYRTAFEDKHCLKMILDWRRSE